MNWAWGIGGAIAGGLVALGALFFGGISMLGMLARADHPAQAAQERLNMLAMEAALMAVTFFAGYKRAPRQYWWFAGAGFAIGALYLAVAGLLYATG